MKKIFKSLYLFLLLIIGQSILNYLIFWILGSVYEWVFPIGGFLGLYKILLTAPLVCLMYTPLLLATFILEWVPNRKVIGTIVIVLLVVTSTYKYYITGLTFNFDDILSVLLDISFFIGLLIGMASDKNDL